MSTYSFHNVLLLVLGKVNKDNIVHLYENHVKKIIFYTDINNDCEVSYTNQFIILFNSLYNNNLIQESDGICVLTNNIVLNINLLHLYSNKDVLFYKELLDTSLFFYIPNKYINETFTFLNTNEPTSYNIITNLFTTIMPNCVYQLFTYSTITDDIYTKNSIFHMFYHKHDLLLVCNNINYEVILKSLSYNKKCVVITTINKPTETIYKHLQNKEYDVIIVGDIKTPDNEYFNLSCIYLDVTSQKKLFPILSENIPYNHYCRKNIGYLYAIKNKYNIIYETDDDNVPYDNFDTVVEIDDTIELIKEVNNKWINIFHYFTNKSHIWPRGYPLSLVKSTPSYFIEKTKVKPSIINGLVENDPDVDALYRLIIKDNIHTWEKNKSFIISNENICVFNTQNTFWINPELFLCMLIPCSVSFRYCDILRGIISNIILKKTNNHMMYTSPNVIQYRNEHNLMSDFKSEIEMYLHNESILTYIDNDILSTFSLEEIIIQIYKNLIKHNVMKHIDLDILQLWIQYFT